MATTVKCHTHVNSFVLCHTEFICGVNLPWYGRPQKHKSVLWQPACYGNQLAMATTAIHQ